MILLSLVLLLIAKGSATSCSDNYSCTVDHISITAQCYSNGTALVQYTGGKGYINAIAIETHCYYYNNDTLAWSSTLTPGRTNRPEWHRFINISINDTYCIFKGCVQDTGESLPRTCHIQSNANCSLQHTPTVTVSSTLWISTKYPILSHTNIFIQPTSTNIYSSDYLLDSTSDTLGIHSPSNTFSVSSISTSINQSYTMSTNILNTNILSTNILSTNILSAIDYSSIIYNTTSSFPFSTMFPFSTTDALQPSSTSSFTFPTLFIVLLAVIGSIALLVSCLALTICITYWYSKYQTIKGKKKFEDFPMFNMEIYKLDKISLSGSVTTVLEPLQHITIESPANTSDIQTDDSSSYNVKRSSSVPIFHSPTISQSSNSTLSLADDESTRTGRRREVDTSTGLPVHCFDNLQDSSKETESPPSVTSTTNDITTSTTTNHHPLSKFPPQLSVINDNTLEYVKMTDLQQHQTEDDEEGYSSMSLYNTALDNTDTHM